MIVNPTVYIWQVTAMALGSESGSEGSSLSRFYSSFLEKDSMVREVT